MHAAVRLRDHHQRILAEAEAVEGVRLGEHIGMNAGVLRRGLQPVDGALRSRAGNHGDVGDVGGLVAKGDPQSERQQQRKDEDPEDDFRLALQFFHARGEQAAIARPAAVGTRRLRRRGRSHLR